jgi:hypothetical protein
MKLSTFVSALSWASFIAMLWMLALGTMKFSVGVLVVLIVLFVIGIVYTDMPANNKPKPPVHS